MKNLDNLRETLYRLLALKDPDPRIEKQLLQEIEKCERHQSADPSTNEPPQKSSAATPGEQRRLI